jgi:small GTP-binding protein
MGQSMKKPQMSWSMKKPKIDHVVFVGNPGRGKSTIINTLLGKPTMEAGFSNNYGGGVTRNVISAKIDNGPLTGFILVDTPGLYDIYGDRTTDVVTELKLKSPVKLVVVIELIAGRIVKDDVLMTKNLLEQMKNQSYSVIINKYESDVSNEDRIKRVIDNFSDCVGTAPIDCYVLSREKSFYKDAILKSRNNIATLHKIILN